MDINKLKELVPIFEEVEMNGEKILKVTLYSVAGIRKEVLENSADPVRELSIGLGACVLQLQKTAQELIEQIKRTESEWNKDTKPILYLVPEEGEII